MNPKSLTESGWKAVVQKFKLKDNGLQKALATYEKLLEEKLADRLKAIAAVTQLAGSLQKVKEVAAVRDADKYLEEILAAAKGVPGEIRSGLALAEKKAAEAKRLEQLATKAAAEDEDEDEEDETGDSLTKLKKALQTLKTAKRPYFFLVCDAKPYGLIVSKKDIRKSAEARKELAKIAGGTTRPPKVGECRFEDGKHVFDMEKPPSGLARILQKWVKTATGVGIKVKVGTESAEDEEDVPLRGSNPELRGTEDEGKKPHATGVDLPEDKEPPLSMTAPFSISSSVGRRGKNKPEDVEAVQVALNRRVKAGLNVDGKCDPKTIKAIEDFQKALGKFKPDGLVEPGRGTAHALASNAKLGPPPEPPKPIAPPKLGKPTLEKAPVVWRGTRGILDTNIKELKKAIRQEYSDEHPDLLAEIDQRMTRLDVVLEKLDHRLADTLANAHAAKDPAARKTEMAKAKAMLVDYLRYVKSEPMIAHMDSNPFGVKTNLQKVLTDSLTHLAKVIH